MEKQTLGSRQGRRQRGQQAARCSGLLRAERPSPGGSQQAHRWGMVCLLSTSRCAMIFLIWLLGMSV